MFSHKQSVSLHKGLIKKIVEIQRLEMMGVLENSLEPLTFLTVHGKCLPKPFPIFGIDTRKVRAMDYSGAEKTFGFLLANSLMAFVEDTARQRTYLSKCTGDEVELSYLGRHRLWLVVFADGSLELFRFEKGRRKTADNKQNIVKFKPHGCDLVGVREIANPLSVVTASRNDSIKIWSIWGNSLLVELNPCREEDFLGCKSLQGFEVFDDVANSYIVCWLFSPEISVWLPSSSLGQPYVGKLKGHTGIVQEVQFLTNFPIAISTDSKNAVRVWNVSKL
jgi:WD40 repeat protein